MSEEKVIKAPFIVEGSNLPQKWLSSGKCESVLVNPISLDMEDGFLGYGGKWFKIVLECGTVLFTNNLYDTSNQGKTGFRIFKGKVEEAFTEPCLKRPVVGHVDNILTLGRFVIVYELEECLYKVSEVSDTGEIGKTLKTFSKLGEMYDWCISYMLVNPHRPNIVPTKVKLSSYRQYKSKPTISWNLPIDRGDDRLNKASVTKCFESMLGMNSNRQELENRLSPAIRKVTRNPRGTPVSIVCIGGNGAVVFYCNGKWYYQGMTDILLNNKDSLFNIHPDDLPNIIQKVMRGEF